jgi:hypothetical protein
MLLHGKLMNILITRFLKLLDLIWNSISVFPHGLTRI